MTVLLLAVLVMTTVLPQYWLAEPVSPYCSGMRVNAARVGAEQEGSSPGWT